MAKNLILPGRLLWNLAIHQILYTYKFKLNWILFPASKNNVLSKKIRNFKLRLIGKIGLVYKSPQTAANFYRNPDQSFFVLCDMYMVIQVYTIHNSSQLLSVWAISAHIQCVLWTIIFITIIFQQIDFVANFLSYTLIEGSSQQLLVISQFSQFFDVMAHISAERRLSKISFSYFYSTWPPPTFETIKFF